MNIGNYALLGFLFAMSMAFLVIYFITGEQTEVGITISIINTAIYSYLVFTYFKKRNRQKYE